MHRNKYRSLTFYFYTPKNVYFRPPAAGRLVEQYGIAMPSAGSVGATLSSKAAAHTQQE
jgi:hypothetical protein